MTVKNNRRHKGPVLDYFDPARIALNKEVKEHPALSALLSNYHPNDFHGMLGEIAAYCGIVIDGYYTDNELNQLCDILHTALSRSRKIIVH